MLLKNFFADIFILFFILILVSCTNDKKQPLQLADTISLEGELKSNIVDLHARMQDGDLLVRLGDDLVSNQIKFLSQTDPSFSHAGIVMTRDNKKVICHIAPAVKGADTVFFEPIDSFINPKLNLACALYRYNLSREEKAAFINELNRFHRQKVHFDNYYDLYTDSVVYCSEMISKSLNKVTESRFQFKTSSIPVRMQPMVHAFFKKAGITKKDVTERKIVAIDALYLIPHCSRIMKFPLKYFP